MKYKFGYARSFTKARQKIKGEDKQLLIDAAIARIEAAPFPFIGDRMKGQWIDSHTYNFGFGRKPEYRILYQLRPCACCQQIQPSALSCTEIDGLDACEVLFIFGLILTREECNNLYSTRKKDIPIFDLPEEASTVEDDLSQDDTPAIVEE